MPRKRRSARSIRATSSLPPLAQARELPQAEVAGDLATLTRSDALHVGKSASRAARGAPRCDASARPTARPSRSPAPLRHAPYAHNSQNSRPKASTTIRNPSGSPSSQMGVPHRSHARNPSAWHVSQSATATRSPPFTAPPLSASRGRAAGSQRAARRAPQARRDAWQARLPQWQTCARTTRDEAAAARYA